MENSTEAHKNKFNSEDLIKLSNNIDVIKSKIDNGEMNLKDVDFNDIKTLIASYNRDTEQLNRETNNIKLNIKKMLKELKNN